jgi:hypothetical protein
MPPSYLGCGLRPAQASNLQHAISKINRKKWTGGVAQAVECMLCQVQSPEFKPQSHQKNKQMRGEEATQIIKTG